MFLVRIFLYLDWIQEDTDQKKLRIWTLFTQCLKYWVANIWRILKYLHKNISKSLCFLGVQIRNLFFYTRLTFSLKLKHDSNDTFSLIILILGWSLYFSPPLDLEFMFKSELASHYFVPNFPYHTFKVIIQGLHYSKS